MPELEVQKYLRSNKTLMDLKSELGIIACTHPSDPLVILNYSQIDSPKTHPIVRECRGLTLELDTWNIVAKAFNRFFNWGECADEMPLFNFNKFSTLSKEDGSLVLIYNYRDTWRANTRGSFGDGKIGFTDKTWQEGFCEAMNVNSLQDLMLEDDLVYVCEYCSMYNKVVRAYPESKMYLLAVYDKEYEMPIVRRDYEEHFVLPRKYEFTSVKQIQEYLQTQIREDPTFEGVVISDGTYRWKVKNPGYLALHQLKGNGDNPFNPKYLLPFILEENTDELLVYFPEAETVVDEATDKVDMAFLTLKNLWEDNWQIVNQKDFALAIVGKTPFTGLLFKLRKEYGDKQTLELLDKEWHNSSEAILKHLFKVTDVNIKEKIA